MGWKWSVDRIILCFAVLAFVASGTDGQGYYGTRLGPLAELQHQVKGEVYAVDSRTIHIRGFSYDGTAPDAFFYAGTTPEPSDRGFIIPDENGGVKPLGRYRNKDVTLTLPDGKTFKDIRWISVWCRAFAIDFGNVRVPSRLDYPRPQKIDALPTLEHGVSSDRIVVVDAQTFLIPNFSYDGAAPDGHFWVGKGSSPGPEGTIVPDENGSEEPLKRYSGKTIVITLPADLTIFDIDFLSVWCRAFFADFGHVRIPKNLNVPPSLKMLGVAPQSQGYSYQPPSSSRPAFSHKPPKTTPRPSYYTPRPPTTQKPSYRPRPSAKNPPSPFTSSGSSYPRPTTPRPAYQPPTTRRPKTTTRRPKPTTRRPYYRPPTTTRRPYTPRPTTRRPYTPRPTTKRPRYRPSRFDSDESKEDNSRERPRHSSSSRGAASHFSQPRKIPSAAHSHFGAIRHRYEDVEEKDDSDEDIRSSESRERSPSHRFGSSQSSDSKSFSSFHFSNGGSTSSFNIYG